MRNFSIIYHYFFEITIYLMHQNNDKTNFKITVQKIDTNNIIF